MYRAEPHKAAKVGLMFKFKRRYRAVFEPHPFRGTLVVKKIVKAHSYTEAYNIARDEICPKGMRIKRLEMLDRRGRRKTGYYVTSVGAFFLGVAVASPLWAWPEPDRVIKFVQVPECSTQVSVPTTTIVMDDSDCFKCQTGGNHYCGKLGQEKAY